MASQIPEKVVEVLKQAGLSSKEAVWDCHGTWVVLHKALEVVAAATGVKFEKPVWIESDPEKKIAVLLVTGSLGDRTEWSIGECATYNNKNAYPYAMAEKRGKDRVILKLVGLHGYVYSEDEADDFKASRKTAAVATPAKVVKLNNQGPAKEESVREVVSQGSEDPNAIAEDVAEYLEKLSAERLGNYMKWLAAQDTADECAFLRASLKILQRG